MKIIKGTVATAQGFTASGLSAGIKRSGKPDLALIYCAVPAVAAGVFTKNSVKAAPLIVTQGKLRGNRAQAILANSGNANCFTGDFGVLYACESAETIAKLLKIHANDVLVASTGIIGKPLPFNKIRNASPALVASLSRNGGAKAARAILTTDKHTKEICVQINLGGKKVTLGAMAKGSGMIAPDMATMLAFITTDAAISSTMLKTALKMATDKSFNCITVDGCMSTNDMAVVLASSLAGNKPITHIGKDFNTFVKALEFICLDLAKKIVLDGEGATKFIEISVSGAKTPQQAKTIGLAIANSVLVKTAAFGSNPNWGRVAAAVGSLGLNIQEKQLKIDFSSFAKKDINISVELSLGNHKATVYTSDLSLDYVRINGSYN
ncbi:MAG TPA: bifunctional glutamate N-acetyltransferase/amino-acid acetyltransferase ArgJ [Candidatus Omnitrophota bacterium]|nr:bifunctional glutamate N-acetyltransferase/amino-acid acetyltransferase ArgJ [Candidatus Omnitrophota bacterium]HPD85345.1 bifunctional glutamate N-acetyltransferase/amino-acid acetyltransferase ArgJ [Candidatus Omnitrophota bacterium]HRZ04154.1 bifunctional glutamate N-acetyltransferase/amino-acid acetyltransferase ArgJ [Candidatus Omnitrophota bacterium]